MRAGLAMYFVTLDDDGLMELAGTIVAELGIEHFFNIQLVGEHVIEINPRISTIVYQEDLNLPTSASSARSARSPTTSCARSARGSGPAAQRCATSTSSSGTSEPGHMRVNEPSLAPGPPRCRHGSHAPSTCGFVTRVVPASWDER